MSNVSDNWKTTSTKTILKTPRFEAVEDEVQQPDGKTAVYHFVRKSPFCIIIPLHDDRTITLVRQYRYIIKSISLEFPMGTTVNEDPEIIAQKELLQETGLKANKWVNLGQYWPGVGSVDQEAHVFVAKDLTQHTPEPEDGEFFDIEKYTIEDVGKLIKSGDIKDAQTIVAFHMLKNYLEKV